MSRKGLWSVVYTARITSMCYVRTEYAAVSVRVGRRYSSIAQTYLVITTDAARAAELYIELEKTVVWQDSNCYTTYPVYVH